jgi:uncharacterized membrane protein YraQ (UPF0718 family)
MFNLLDHFYSLANSFFNLFVISAPWLLFGFVIAALIKAFVNMDLMHKYLGGNSLWVSVKAALIGAPLPLCSCGVVPAALGLRASGASKNATVSFLVATPETGVDSVSFTYALMGPVMAIARPIAAISSAIVSGFLVGNAEDEVSSEIVPSKPCCASKNTCEEETVNAPIEKSFSEKLKEGFVFSFGKMLRDIVNWLLFGLFIAAVVQTFVPSSFFEVLGDGFLSMLVMAVIGIPMYVCATASTPIAAGFLLAGLSPGAVLVFMLLGPASNIGTLMIIRKELGTRAVTAYLSGIVASAFAFGFAMNALSEKFGWDFTKVVNAHQHESFSVFAYLSALTLALFVLRALWVNARA